MNVVKELRERANIQQKELALAIGVTQPTVSDWEHGRKDPSGDRLERVAKFFGVDIAVIKGYSPIPGTQPNIETSEEWQSLAPGWNAMTKEERQRVVQIIKMIYPNRFEEE